MDIEKINTQLHVRMYVAKILADRIGDSDFIELAEKMMSFILRGIEIPSCPAPSFIDIIGRIDEIVPLQTGKHKKEEDENSLEYLFDYCYKGTIVRNPKNPSMIGRIHGYSTEFDALIAGCKTDGAPGLEPSESDFFGVYHKDYHNGIFYIKAEEVERQINERNDKNRYK